MLATIGLGALALAGCAESAPSVTTAEPVTLPTWVTVPEEVDVEQAYAVGEHDGVVFTALEADDDTWCLAMHRDDDALWIVSCGEGPVVSGAADGVANARLEIDGVEDAGDGEAISDWVVVLG